MPDLGDLILEDCDRIVERVDLAGLRDQSILITGASGLLGLHMIGCFKRLAQKTGRPVQVAAVTRSGIPDHLASLFRFPGLSLWRGDIADTAFVASLPAAGCVIHAAGYGQPGKFLENPVTTIRINTTATASLLEKVVPGGKALFVSSSEIYSGSTRTPHRETDIGTTDPMHPRACYIEGKRCGEAICYAFRQRGCDVKAARLALAYGSGTGPTDQRVLNSLIRKALLDGRIALLDQGRAIRTYCHVTDAVELLLRILLSGREPVYNVGGHSTVTILELAQAIGRITGVAVTVPEQEQELAGAPADVALDLSRVRDEFGKNDFVSLESGLEHTIAWQRELYRTLGLLAGTG
ncbi:NAD-dependent epimerase/dehydratase family protein [Azospirillum sp.]|uniref:NAD-dependent epimerase/dehydratase family protein n=1 Tax=Azospirillum sp. TaxID=34012 RepID=UPI003D73859F